MSDINIPVWLPQNIRTGEVETLADPEFYNDDLPACTPDWEWTEMRIVGKNQADELKAQLAEKDKQISHLKTHCCIFINGCVSREDIDEKMQAIIIPLKAQLAEAAKRLEFEQFRTQSFKELSGIDVNNMGEIVEYCKQLKAQLATATARVKELQWQMLAMRCPQNCGNWIVPFGYSARARVCAYGNNCAICDRYGIYKPKERNEQTANQL